MDEAPFPASPELPEELRLLVKPELAPGERLLWAAEAIPRPSSSGKSSVIMGLLALAFWVVSGAAIIAAFGYFGRKWESIDGVLLGIGVFGTLIGLFIFVGLVVDLIARSSSKYKRARRAYALTDLRAILWLPVDRSDAVAVHTVPRGTLKSIHRVEHPDGSGDVVFNGVQMTTFGEPLGFTGIAEVRRVEEMVRRALLPTGAEVAWSDGIRERSEENEGLILP